MGRDTHHVQAVRQRGGECVGVVRGRVRVEREGGEVDREVGEDYQEWEEERSRGMEDKRAVAEVRGREAEVKLVRDNWMQERLRKAEIERRESVKLMEMLRTAKMMRNPKITQVVEVGVGAQNEADDGKCMANNNDDMEVGPEKRVDDVDASRKRRVIESSNRPSKLAGGRQVWRGGIEEEVRRTRKMVME